MAQAVKKICLQCRRHRFNPGVKKIPWRRKWQPTPMFLLGKSHGQRSQVGYSPWGHKSVGHNWATEHAHTGTMSKGRRMLQFQKGHLLRDVHKGQWIKKILSSKKGPRVSSFIDKETHSTVQKDGSAICYGLVTIVSSSSPNWIFFNDNHISLYYFILVMQR